MVALRKTAVLLALLGLVTLSGGVAQAQNPQTGLVTCTATAVPPIVRAEGIAELVGDIVMTCIATPGAPAVLNTTNTFLVNVSVSLNVNITNNFNFGAGGNVTDAVLVINENNCMEPDEEGSTFAPPAANGHVVRPMCDPNDLDPRFQAPQYGTRPAGVENRLEWNEVSFPIPGAEEFPGCDPMTEPDGQCFFPLVTTLRITALRGNAAQLGIVEQQAVFPSTQIRAFVSITGPTTISVNNNDLNVAIPIIGLIWSVGDPVLGLQCIDGHESTSITLEEGFATAFKTLGAPTFFPGNTQWESGYFAPGSNKAGFDGGKEGGASNGTRFLLRLTGIPEGLEVTVPRIINHYTVTSTASLIGPNELHQDDQCIIQSSQWNVGNDDIGQLNAGTLPLSRVQTLKAFCTSDALELAVVSGAASDGDGGAPVDTTGDWDVTLSGGAGMIVYEVTDNDPFRVESCSVPITFWWEADTVNDRPEVTSGQISATFAPVSAVFVASDDDEEPEPRFIDNPGDPLTIITIRRCTTTLLFPFVTNQRTFDTGIAISNTSEDWLGTGVQTGACTIHYHGETTGGGDLPFDRQTSSPITGGEQLVFTLSGGNEAQLIQATPEFQGYIIAECQFQYAHGFAFITNGFGGLPSLAQGYLALVIPLTDEEDRRKAGVPGLHTLGESLSH